MNQHLYHITVDWQRFNNEMFTWTTYLRDLVQVRNDLFDTWTTSQTNAMLLDYADAVEYQIKLREFFPHAKISIIAAE